jgi:iron complex outermembrane receptor protein
MRKIFVPGTARFLQTCSAAALMLVITATPAIASSAEAEPQDQGSGPQATDSSGEIVVTASRRAERAIDVPVAVTAVAGEKLGVLNSSGLDIRFLSARTPSLLIESSFGRTFPRFYIRGLGNTDFDPNAAQPVAVIYDGVVLENPMAKSFPVFDIASVEVLRGPQGTLFGRNSPAGVVKIDSVKPGDTYSGYAQASWGTFNTVNAEAAVGGPIAEGLSFRASGILQRRDDWVHNIAPVGRSDPKLEGYRDVAGRLQLGYTSGDFNLLLNVHARDLDGTARIFRANSLIKGTNRFVPDFNVRESYLDAYNSQDLSAFGASARADYTVDGLGTFYSTTGYEKVKIFTTSDIDGGYGAVYALPTGPGPGVPFTSETANDTRPKEFSQELRFASQDMGGFLFQGGAYYFRQTLKYSEYENDFDGVRVGVVDHDNVNKNFGLFASGEYKVTDALTVRGGIRYSKDNKHDLTARTSSPYGFSFPAYFDTKVKGSNVSWDLSATYKLTENANAYVRYATGYLGPAIQDRVTFADATSTAKAETVDSIEAGIKTRLLGIMQFDFTGYYYKVKNLQQTAVGGAINTAQLINAKRADGYGFEADLDARPIDHLVLTASTSYNHTEIKDPTLGIAPCGGGCTVLDPVVNGIAQINGNPLPQAQKWIANATARYAVPVGGGGDEVFAYGDLAYLGSANIFLYEAIEYKTRPYTEIGLRIGYKTASNFEVAGFVRNLLDQIRVTSAVDFNNITTMVNDPRTWGVSVSKRF